MIEDTNEAQDPGLMDALGIANDYWHTSRIKSNEEQTGKTFRYQIPGLIRGEKHIYTETVCLIVLIGILC